MATLKVNFEYNEPRFGSIEIEGPDWKFIETEYDYEHEHLDKQSDVFVQNMFDKIIDSNPAALDVELIEIKEID